MSKVDSLSGYETIPPQGKNFPIKISKYESTGGPNPHWHEHLELLLFTGGSCTVIINGQSLLAEEGDLIAVNGGEVHSFQRGNGVSYLCLLIYPELLCDVEVGGAVIRHKITDPALNSLVEEIYLEYTRGGVGSDMMQKSLAYSLLSSLYRSYAEEGVSEKERALDKQARERLDGILSFVIEHYTEEISTRDIAAASFLSLGYFCRFFKSMTGKSPIEYLNEYRIERASVLLEKTELSHAEVGAAVGIHDPNYFARLYKRIKGISPGEYRLESLKATK